MAEGLHWYFLGFYAIGLIVVIFRIVPAAAEGPSAAKRAEGWRFYLPALLIPFHWVLPPLLILFRAGEVHAEWPVIRLLGFLLSVYAAVMLLWAPSTLGRFLVPYAAVFEDHELVTAGPYGLVRHPIYSGVLALSLGAAIGTLNLYLMLLWPVAAFGSSAQAGFEEQLLRERFGASYESYARRTGRFVPRLRPASS